jgi:hypothetical protein
MHDDLLAEVIAEWTASGVLLDLVQLVRDVWSKNITRHEPGLGDDALTLGLTSSRNLANRTVELFGSRPDVTAELENNSLRVVHRGRILRAYKLPGKSILADPEEADWDSSTSKLQGPSENSWWTQPSLFDRLPGEPSEPGTTPGPKYLHLAWAGDPDTGDVAVHLGFPCDRELFGSPWLAVDLVYTDQVRELEPTATSGAGPTDRYDERPSPTVAVHLREASDRHLSTDDVG